MSRRESRTAPDGKVDIQCPQCAVRLRVREEVLDDKIECSECHRVFIPRKTIGRRVTRPDHSKAVLGIVAGVVLLVGVFIAMSSGGGDSKSSGKGSEHNAAAKAPKGPAYTLTSHPRAQQLLKWAQAVADDNRLVLQTHGDLDVLAKDLGVSASDRNAVLQAFRTHDLARHLRELQSTRASLATNADMENPTGKGTIYLSARIADPNYDSSATGEVEVSFRMDGEQLRVTGFWTRVVPPRRPGAK